MRKSLLLLAIIANIASASHVHLWTLQSQSAGFDAFGNPVTVCTWVCTLDPRNAHYATTSGQGFCPMPLQ
jgi:hypothetical protein